MTELSIDHVKGTLVKYLFMLEKFDLLVKKKHGKTFYYYRGKKSQKIELMPSADATDFSIRVIEYYKNSKDEKQRSAFLETIGVGTML